MVLDNVPAQIPRNSLTPQSGLPPHDISAEEAVIAALLLDNDAYARIVPIIQPNDFFREHNGWIYEVCLQLADRNETITIPTVAHELLRLDRLELVGGETYLQDLAGNSFPALGVESPARIIARAALYRRLLQTAGQIAQLANAGGADVSHVIRESEALLLNLRSAEASGDFRRLRELLDDFLEVPSDEEEIDTVIRSGFMDLDELLGGFKRGDLLVLAARTCRG